MGNCECQIDLKANFYGYYSDRLLARCISHCNECGRLIDVGELHELALVVRENSLPFSFGLCNDCVSIRDALFCDAFPLRHLWQAVRTHVLKGNEEGLLACIPELTSGARQKACAIIEEHWEIEEKREKEIYDDCSD